MKKFISTFHYLTQDLPNRSHAEQTQLACEAGANWIQYRCFSKTDKEMLAEIHQIASICDDWGATLLLTDHYHLLDKVDAQGVHLEDMDADFHFIREVITNEKTLGASANTIEDITRISESGVVDYVGCGPFSDTQTKPNNYPLLGIGGYQQITDRMKQMKINLPLIAVGGIRLNDIDALLQTGIHGIAISGAINNAEDPGQAFLEMYNKIR